MDDPLTLDRMCIELDTKYEKIYKKKDYDPEYEDKKKSKRRNSHHGMALVANRNGVFKGRCYTCRNWGHKSQQCLFRNNRNNQNTQNLQNAYSHLNAYQNRNTTNIPTANYTNSYVPPRRPRFPGKCDHCRKWGHKCKDCWLLKNQLRNSEKANVYIPATNNVEETGVEEEVVLINKMPTMKNEKTGLNEIRNDI